jgi:hypothetical protein
VLAVVGMVAIAIATLTPVRDVGAAILTPITCLVCGERGGADVAANLLLFLPLAVGLRLSGHSWLRTVLVAAAVSFTVELLQLRVVPGRDASLSDLLSNTTSAAIGAAMAPVLPGALAPARRRAWAFLGGGSAVVLALLAVSAWLLTPDIPDGQLFSRLAEQERGAEVFAGSVRSLRLNGVLRPAGGLLPDSAALRRQLDEGNLTLEAELVSGAPVVDRAWIYILRVPSGTALVLSQVEREAGVAVPARARRYRFDLPLVTLADALPATSGIPVRLLAQERGRRVTLRSEYGGVVRSVELGISPAFGWVMLVPLELAVGTHVRWVTGLCLAALFFPLGYWAGWTRRRLAPAAWLAGMLLLALAALPGLAGLPPVHWSEWLSGALGAAAGWAAQPPAAYLQRRCASPSGSDSSSS